MEAEPRQGLSAPRAKKLNCAPLSLCVILGDADEQSSACQNVLYQNKLTGAPGLIHTLNCCAQGSCPSYPPLAWPCMEEQGIVNLLQERWYY